MALVLVPNRCIALTAADLAERLLDLACRIEVGELVCDRVVVVLQMTEGPVDYRVYGPRTSSMALVGLLEYAKAEVMHPTTPPENG